MRQQCVVPCYWETRSQLTIQVDCGLVKSQLSLPTRTDNFSFILFFEKTRFSIYLLSLYLSFYLSPHMLGPGSSKRSSIASGSAQWFDERSQQYSESLPNRPDARRNTVQC